MKNLSKIQLFNFIYLILLVALDVNYILNGNAYIFKTLPSALFVVGGLVNLIVSFKYAQKPQKSFSILMFVGLVFACAGDILLIDFFIIGAGLFAVGHIFFFVAFMCLTKFSFKDLLYGLILAGASITFILTCPIFELSGSMLYVVIIYALIISLMVGKSITTLKNNTLTNTAKNLILVGAIMFFASDFMLLLCVFGGVGLWADVLCLLFYYPAQYLLSIAIVEANLTASEKTENIYQKIWCRIYQFVMRLVLPLMPYREPVLLENYEGLVDVLQINSIKKVMLVTDKGINSLGLTKDLEKSLKKAKISCVVFEDVVPNPTISNVENGLQIYKKENCEGLIAFGGGSVMDCAKAIGARVVKPNKPLQKMKGLLKIRKHLPLLIAIPTTAGTGSETTVTAVITDDKTHYKYTINDFSLIPHYALLDYKITIGLPKHITSTTGMDALTHAVEAYIGGSTTRYTKKMSEDATKLIFENILKAYETGNDEKARQNMLLASYYAGIAFTRSYVGYVHAVAHTLGGQYGVAHGLANAVILPIMLEEYGKSAYKKLGTLAKKVGLVVESESNELATKKFVEHIKYLNKKMNIPSCIKEIKIEDISSMAKKAAKEANPLYPVPQIYNAKKLEKIYLKVKG